jgi:hypothetical protein
LVEVAAQLVGEPVWSAAVLAEEVGAIVPGAWQVTCR